MAENAPEKRKAILIGTKVDIIRDIRMASSAAQGVIAASAGYVGRAERERRPAVAAMQQPDTKAAFDRYNFYLWRHTLKVP
ncbi:hypothetical protein MRX96_023060 [Rhipicephalus microplus]